MHYLPQSIPVRIGFYRVIVGFCSPRNQNPNGPMVAPRWAFFGLSGLARRQGHAIWYDRTDWPEL